VTDRLSVIVVAAALCCASHASAQTPSLVNVARRELGVSAAASRIYGPAYEAINAFDGRWKVRETDKWNSALNVTPHWLRVDLGRGWPIQRVVIRHEWKEASTSDFRIQRADSPVGPWTDVVPPIRGNRDEVSRHDFAPVPTRHLRLFITKAEQKGNAYGRIFEVEVYAETDAIELPDLARAEWMLRDAERSHFGPGSLTAAAKWLDSGDPFVRGIAEWIIARKVGQDNNSQKIVWPADEQPEWFRKWVRIPLAQRIEMDWVRQAVALSIHHGSDRLVGSVDEMIDRGEKLLRTVVPAKRAEARERFRSLCEVRKRMDGRRDDVAALRRLWLEARRALRPIVFADSAIDFDAIVFCTRYAMHYKPNVCGVHVSWAYKPGGDICVLSDLESGRDVRPLIEGQLGPGHVHGLDLWFDGSRIAFGWANQDRWPPVKSTSWPRRDNECFAFELRNNTEPPHLYEMDIDGREIRQLTDHDFWTDVEPVYCPDGSIVFTSDRSAHSPSCDSYCNDLTDHNLYLLTADQRWIRRLTNQKDVDMHPHLLDNGLIAYLRWEYQERHFWDVHSVWTIRPDGTMADALFKQHLGAPTSVRDARSVPGTGWLVAIAAGHHCLPKGPVVILDPSKGLNSQDGVRLLTRGPRPQERSATWRGKRTWQRNLVSGGGVRDAGGFYMTPYALSATRFLVSYAYGSWPARKYRNYSADVDSNGAGIYLIDSYGSKELIYRHPLYCCESPIPLKARERPPASTTTVDYSKNFATCIVPDVTEGMEGVAPGTIKHLRIAEALPWPIVPGQGVKRWDLSNRWCPVRVIGTVPVEADGSAHFKVPVADNASVYFQALDSRHMEIRRMRTSVSFQPGEVRSCNGCHETRADSPKEPQGIAARRAPDRPTPPPWGCEQPIGFERLVQPVLDKHCITCHGGPKPKKGLRLERGKAYAALVKGTKKKPALVSLSNPNSDGRVTQVKQFGSHRSKLIQVLLAGHQKVRLSDDEWLTLVTWVDANAPYQDRLLSKRTADGRRNVWETYEWRHPWAAPRTVSAR